MDLRWILNSRRGYHERRVPRNVFSHFASLREMFVKNVRGSTSDWVSARFSPYVDEFLCIGGNDGSVGLYNVALSLEEDSSYDAHRGVQGSCVKAHNGAVMGVHGVPGRANEVLSIGGDGSAKIWDMETGRRIACFGGHVTSVRSACFNPEDPDVFVTCGRDGKFCINDRRCQTKKDRNGLQFIPPSQSVEDAHFSADCGRRFQGIKDPPGLTNIIYLDEHNIITASDKSLTGIRFWDPRKLDSHTMVRTLKVPQHRSCRQAGVASMAVDRFRSHLYVAVTDHAIYEYALGSECNTSVRSLLDARTNFDTTLATSPISDHLICGSTNSTCVLYDLQDRHRYLDDLSRKPLSIQLRPSYAFEGHDSDVSAVSWSCHGTYVVTVDNTKFRVWAPNHERDAQDDLLRQKDNFPAFQRITVRHHSPVKASTRATEAVFRRMSVSEGSLPRTRSNTISSPNAKRSRKTAESSPLSDLTNSPSTSRKSLSGIIANLPRRRAESPEAPGETTEQQTATVSTPKMKLQDFGFFQRETAAGRTNPGKAPVLDSPSDPKRCASPVSSKRSKRRSTLHHYFCQ